MTEYLTADDLLTIAEAAMGSRPLVRDAGLLASAAARPQTTVFGEDAYPSLEEKAAALLHALARNHPAPVPAGAAARRRHALIPLRRNLCLSALQ